MNHPLTVLAIAFTLLPVIGIAHACQSRTPPCDPVLEVRTPEGACQSRAQVRGPAPALPE